MQSSMTLTMSTMSGAASVAGVSKKKDVNYSQDSQGPGSVKKKGNLKSNTAIKTKRFLQVLDDNDKIVVKNIAKKLVEPGKGLFLVDTPIDKLNIQMEAIGIASSFKSRMRYIKSLLGCWQDWRLFVSGVTLCIEVLEGLQKRENRSLLASLLAIGTAVGITVNHAPAVIAGTRLETTVTGIDTLSADCKRAKEMGASFVMVSGVCHIDVFSPSKLFCSELSNSLARCATTAQAAGLVSILSLTFDQNSTEKITASQRREIMEQMFASLIKSLSDHHVYIEGVIIRLNLKLPKILLETSIALARSVFLAIKHRIPPALGGVMIGELSDINQSTEITNAINYSTTLKPCPVTFALGEHITKGMLYLWGGFDDNNQFVSKEITRRLKICNLASMGQLPKDQYTFFVTKVDTFVSD